jgi:alginate O-acetyltransferase complex protein AlgI
MLFNSLQFSLFLLIVFFLYWLVFYKTVNRQNLLLLLASLFFYGWADYRFLFLLIISILVNYYIGLAIFDTNKETNKKRLLWVGLVFNIGVLGYFKYYNFFFESFVDFFNMFNANLEYSPLKILLPLGVSFFTFQMLGYILDLYRERIEPSHNLLAFSVYVAFFPKLLAGPIERAQRFLPQIEIQRNFDVSLVTDGLRQILWGLFAKLVISNNCAIYANYIFDSYKDSNGGTLFLGTFFYTFQIYGDFSGYSNIALGVSKLFGIRLMTNFATPFFSTNISDFWKKWHISLTSWMMDYIYNPLSFKLRNFKKVGLSVSIVATFLLVGFWHGAEWKYILYGLLHGIYFIPLMIFKSSRREPVVAKGRLLPSFAETLQMAGLFLVVSVTIILFRAPTVSDALMYFSGIFTNGLFSTPDFMSRGMALLTVILVIIFVLIEWFSREKIHPFYEIEKKCNTVNRWIYYYTITFMIFVFSGVGQPFIYLQF